MSSNSNPPPNNDLHVADNSFLPQKPKQKPYKFTKGLAFFSSLVFFLVISIFIIFKNLSFSSLFNSTNFWFFISNTLVLIIAADYGVFSPSDSKPKTLDFYENPQEQLKIMVEGRDLLPPLKTPARTFRRSKSEKPKRSEERKMTGKRSESVTYIEAKEENEFEKMTDEELNKRVEEFIQRFKLQSRTQKSVVSRD